MKHKYDEYRRYRFKSLETYTKDFILNTLKYCNGNMTKAAKKLKISRKTVSRYYKKYQAEYEKINDDLFRNFLLNKENEIMSFIKSKHVIRPRVFYPRFDNFDVFGKGGDEFDLTDIIDELEEPRSLSEIDAKAIQEEIRNVNDEDEDEISDFDLDDE